MTDHKLILNGGSRRNVNFWAKHLMSTAGGQLAELTRIHGLGGLTLKDCLREMESIAKGSNTKNFMYHANMNPAYGQDWTEEQWEKAWTIFEEERGLKGQPHVEARHTKKLRRHKHRLYLRIRTDSLKAIPDSKDAEVCRIARARIERELGLDTGATPGPLPMPGMAYRKYEYEQCKRRGTLDPRATDRELARLWKKAATGTEFIELLRTKGWRLAMGRNNSLVVFDDKGGFHGLRRGLRRGLQADIRKADVMAKCGDLDLNLLPTFEQAKAGATYTPIRPVRKMETTQTRPPAPRTMPPAYQQPLPKSGSTLRAPPETRQLSQMHLLHQREQGHLPSPPLVATRSAATPNAMPVKQQSAKTGPAAMWEEYPIYKAAGMLAAWRSRWMAYLRPNGGMGLW